MLSSSSKGERRELSPGSKPNWSSDYWKETDVRIVGVVLGAFFVGVLAGVFLLAYRSSQETQKSLPESFADVPAEAKKVYVEVRTRATEAVKQARASMTEGEVAGLEPDAAQWPAADYVEGIQ